MTVWVDTTLVCLALTSVLLLGSSRLTRCIRIVAFQGVLLGVLTVAVHAHAITVRVVILAAAIFALKGFVFPWLLSRVLREADVHREIEPLVREREVSDQRMMEPFRAAAVDEDVVARPAHPEFLAPRRQLADEVGQHPVIRVAARLAAELRHDVVRGPLPIGVEGPGARVQEREACGIGGLHGVAELLGVERRGQRVGVEDVETPVPDERRNVGHRVDDPLDARSDPLRRRSAAGRSLRVRQPGQVKQVLALGLVKLEGTADAVQHVIRHAARVAAL